MRGGRKGLKITESRSATLRLSSDGQQNLSRGVKQRRQTPPFFCAHSPQRVSPHSGQKKALPAEICFLQPLHAAVLAWSIVIESYLPIEYSQNEREKFVFSAENDYFFKKRENAKTAS